MELLTKEIISKFEKHPFESQQEKGIYAEVLVKYFNPNGNETWLITEAERIGDDLQLFGCYHFFEEEWHWVWGSLSLSDLETFHVPIERDLHVDGATVCELVPDWDD